MIGERRSKAMAEYIDKKYLGRKFQIDMMCLRGGTIFDTKEIIDSLPTADVIERSKVDKVIEEIEILQKYEFSRFSEDTMFHKALSKCLEILKRNIGE